jgi:ABC-type Fe3+-hydroxamate transport system substrate-binding protein
VKAGRAYALGGDTWLFGGPLSAEALVNIVVKALAP